MTDWNPNDPEQVKVHYDVSAWTVDQRAELAEALAEATIPHSWGTDDEGHDELIVPEDIEGPTDELFGRLEAALGPFPIPLGDEPNAIEYGLDEWPVADRNTLTAAVVEAEVPHRWEGATLFVPAAAETVVDDLLDALEAGTLAVHGNDDEAPPENALSELFANSDRLAKDPFDRTGRDEITALVGILVPNRSPYGIGGAAWSGIVDLARRLADITNDQASTSSDIIDAAQGLRTALRDYV